MPKRTSAAAAGAAPPRSGISTRFACGRSVTAAPSSLRCRPSTRFCRSAIASLRSRRAVAAPPPADAFLRDGNRELVFEGSRRTDLVRFGLFSSGTYLWAWKGGVVGGQALLAGRDLYPIPANQLIANPNLKQNTGY